MTNANEQTKQITITLKQGTMKTELDANTVLRLSCSMLNGVTGLCPANNNSYPPELEALKVGLDERSDLPDASGVGMNMIVAKIKASPTAKFDGRTIEVPIYEHHVWSGETLSQRGTLRIKLVKSVNPRILDSPERDAARKQESQSEMDALTDFMAPFAGKPEILDELMERLESAKSDREREKIIMDMRKELVGEEEKPKESLGAKIRSFFGRLVRRR